MKEKTFWSRPALVALCVAVAACTSPTEQPVDNDAAIENAPGPAPEETDINAADASTRSILRPEVSAPTPEPPALQPVDATIAFDSSGLILPDASRTLLDGLVDGPAMKAGGPIILRGHSDTRGSDRANLAASRKRAEIVAAYLNQKGIAADRMTIIALGETTPILPNARPDGSDDPAARAKNRRVDIHVDLPAAAPPPDDRSGPEPVVTNQSGGASG